MTAITDILFTEKGQLGVITLNRPQALNALTQEMILEMYQQLGGWANDPHIKGIVIRAAEGKAFCAGGDIRKVYEARNNPELAAKFFWHEYRLNRRIYHYPKPFISFLDGITMGGGAGISINGSHRIATENFLFAMPETGIGFFTDIGATFFLPRCPDQTGVYLALTGARIRAGDAVKLKFVDAFVTQNKLPMLLDALSAADYNADLPRDVVSSVIKRFSNDSEAATLTPYHPHIELCFSHQTVENIINALETHHLAWCHEVANVLKTKSPTSLKVTLHALRHGAMFNFDQCMQTEYRLAVRFLAGHDFYEGVRAVIIDKDQRPFWQPGNLALISESDVEGFFAPLRDMPELSFA